MPKAVWRKLTFCSRRSFLLLPKALHSAGMTISLAEVQQLAEEMTEIDPQIERERYQDTIVERIMTVDPTVKDDVIGAFRAFDPEDSGNISVVMLRYVLQTLGEPLEDAAVDEMLR
eukprot:2406287-Prorocentrum_lima.AAC.1